MWHVWGRGVVHAGDWWGNPRERRLDFGWNNTEMGLQDM